MHDLAFFLHKGIVHSNLKCYTLLMEALAFWSFTNRKFQCNVMQAYVLRKKISGGRGKVATDLRLLAFALLYLLWLLCTAAWQRSRTARQWWRPVPVCTPLSGRWSRAAVSSRRSSTARARTIPWWGKRSRCSPTWTHRQWIKYAANHLLGG